MWKIILVLLGSRVSPGTGKAGDRHHRKLHGDHVPATNGGFAKLELTWSISEQVHSQLACCNTLFIF